jgi:two-component system sensor histidine kinase UhpB
MKTATEQALKVPVRSAFRTDYLAALAQYISHGDEAALGRGYEIGRKAMAEGKSLMDFSSVHHEALREILADSRSDQATKHALKAGAHFLAETLSPYEMAHRGFQDAVSALRQMNERLEQQIKSIAYSVHDEAGQLLAAVHLALASLTLELPAPQQEQIIQIEELLSEVERQLRQYSHELRPTVLDDLGWVPAIRFLAQGVSKRANLPIHVETELTDRLPAPAETAIYRVVQEALNNIVKHSGATAVWISAEKAEGVLRCSVRDNGSGFSVASVRSDGQRRGLGLSSMKERLNAVGGALHIESSPGNGTQLLMTLPLETN